MNWKLLKKLSTTEYWLLCFGILLALGQFQRLSFSFLPSFYLHDVVGIIFVCKNLADAELRQKLSKLLKSLQQKKALVFLAGWIVFGIVRAVVLDGWDLLQLLYFGRILIYLLLGFFIYQRLLQLPKAHLVFSQVIMIVTGLYISLFGIAQRLLLPDTRFLAVYGWDDHLYRLISTWFDPGFTGLALLLVLLFVVMNPIRYKIVLCGILAVSLVLTNSRATYLSGLLSLPLLVLRQQSHFLRKIIPTVLAAVILVIVFTLISQPYGEGTNLLRTTSISARFTSSSMYLEQLSPLDWLMGKGLFSSRSGGSNLVPNNAHLPDNSLVTLLYGTGIIGLATTSYLIAYAIKTSFVGYQDLYILLGATFIHSQFHASFTHSLSLLLLVLLVSLSCVKINLAKAK